MPESKIKLSICPLCGANEYESEIMTRADGTVSEGWFRCVKCKRYTVSPRSAKPHIFTYTKPRR
jgi:hypothetical protein